MPPQNGVANSQTQVGGVQNGPDSHPPRWSHAGHGDQATSRLHNVSHLLCQDGTRRPITFWHASFSEGSPSKMVHESWPASPATRLPIQQMGARAACEYSFVLHRFLMCAMPFFARQGPPVFCPCYLRALPFFRCLHGQCSLANMRVNTHTHTHTAQHSCSRPLHCSENTLTSDAPTCLARSN